MEPNDIVYSVISMLAVDGSINIQEMTFLKNLCNRLEFPVKEIHPIVEAVRKGQTKVHFPDGAAEKKELFDLLVQAAVADGRVADKERKLLDSVAAKLKMSKADVKQAINACLK